MPHKLRIHLVEIHQQLCLWCFYEDKRMEWGQLLVFFRLSLAFFSFLRADPIVVFEFGSYLV